MDDPKLQKLRDVISDLTGVDEPTDDELEENEDLAELYEEIHNMKIALENFGFDFDD